MPQSLYEHQSERWEEAAHSHHTHTWVHSVYNCRLWSFLCIPWLPRHERFTWLCSAQLSIFLSFPLNNVWTWLNSIKSDVNVRTQKSYENQCLSKGRVPDKSVCHLVLWYILWLAWMDWHGSILDLSHGSISCTCCLWLEIILKTWEKDDS